MPRTRLLNPALWERLLSNFDRRRWERDAGGMSFASRRDCVPDGPLPSWLLLPQRCQPPNHRIRKLRALV